MLESGFNEEGWNDELQCTIDERIALRKVLLSKEGLDVFKWLLHNLRVMKPIRDERDVPLQQFGHKILGVMGLSDVDSHDKVFEYYSIIAGEQTMNPRKMDLLRRKMNVGHPDG